MEPDFESWLRECCFQKPTPEAYDLAKCAWQESRERERRRCRSLMDRVLNDAWDAFAARIIPQP